MGRPGMVKSPVRTVAHFSRVFEKGVFVKETGIRYTVQARLLGTTLINTPVGPKELPFVECGHNHLTEAGAEPCRRRLQRLYDAKRSQIALRAARKRKLATLSPIQQKSLQPQYSEPDNGGWATHGGGLAGSASF